VDEWFHEQIVKHERIDPFKSEQWVATQFLSSVVWKAMNEVLGKPAEVMKWLQTCAKLNANIDQPMTWTTPSGFPVRQRYISYKKKKVETLLGEKISYVDFNEDTDDIDRRRQSNGVSPNFVHSLDAAAVHQTVNTCIDQKLLSLAMVHDSYATQSPKCDQLAGILRHSYANIFSEDLLTKFRESVDTTEQKNVPALPSFGSLDPMEVLASEYFFA
jgi:DNA-directed RNA polymerase